jgi:hypothetical protein
MMTNFIDPELPTNDKIVQPGCWCENYAVRCTAEISTSTHSNLTGDSAGFYLRTKDVKSNVVSLIFGILTGNLGKIIVASINLAKKDPEPEYEIYANEVAQVFEVYIGDAKTVNYDWSSEYPIGEDDNTLYYAAKEGKIKRIKPQE